MINSLLINYKSPYLVPPPSDFDKKTQSRADFTLLPKSTDSLQKSADNPENKLNWGYLPGVIASISQAIAGLLIIPASLISKRENETVEAEIKKLGKNATKDREDEILEKHGKNSYIHSFGEWLKTKSKISEKLLKNPETRHILGRKLNRIGWKFMGAGWIIGIPSFMNASLNERQASMFSGSLVWLISSPLMLLKKFEDSARLIGFSLLGYSLMYAGMANKVKNDGELKKGENPRVFEFDKINKNNFFSKSAEFLKFVKKDLSALPESGIKAVSQGYDYITGKRKEPPEFWTIKPTENNSKLASLLLLPGSALLMAFGKENKYVEKIANILVGTGLLSEALYMYTLGNAKKGLDKSVILAGVPLRAVGDFAQTNPFMLGMRTLGGASFEYYFATLNKQEEAKKAKVD